METVSPALVTDIHAGALPELAGDGRLSLEVLGRQPMSWSAKAEAAHLGVDPGRCPLPGEAFDARMRALWNGGVTPCLLTPCLLTP